MKNYAHKTNKKMTRYRTPSMFRANYKYDLPAKNQPKNNKYSANN